MPLITKNKATTVSCNKNKNSFLLISKHYFYGKQIGVCNKINNKEQSTKNVLRLYESIDISKLGINIEIEVVTWCSKK